MAAPSVTESLDRLSRGERLDLISRIWESLDLDGAPVSPAVATELDRRWAAHERNPGAALTLDELMARVKAMRR